MSEEEEESDEEPSLSELSDMSSDRVKR